MQPSKKTPALRDITSLVHTLLLFTYSEHVTVLAPWTAFGIAVALSGPPLTTSTTDGLGVLKRLPHTALWIWLNLLAFTISNQRLPESVAEDAINKSWRPVPSGRITIVQTRRLLLVVIPIVVLAACKLGGLDTSMATLLMAWMYNDLGGANDNFITRQLLNAGGMASWCLGTALVACGDEQCSLSTKGYLWTAIPGAIILTTVQLMDLRDQAGDLASGRSTLPLVLGDTAARWTIVVAITSWSLVCPKLWSLGWQGSLLPLALGALISGRVLVLRTVKADRASWKLWGLWIFSIFMLPLVKNHGALERTLMRLLQALQRLPAEEILWVGGHNASSMLL